MTLISLATPVQLVTNQVYAINSSKTLFFNPRTNLQTSNDQTTWTAVPATGVVKQKFMRCTSGTPLVVCKSCIG